MRRALLLACIVAIAVIAGLYATRPTGHEYQFETVEGMKISVSDGAVYLLGLAEREAPYIEMVGGWNLTLDEGVRVSNVLKCFGGRVYAAGVDVVKVEDGKISWVKDLVEKKLSYEGARLKLVEREYPLNVFDIESDGEFLYFNVREGIVKANEDLNVVWAVRLRGTGFGNLNDDIAVSDGIYLTKDDGIVKLSRDGGLEWAISLKSREKVGVEIPEEKREVVGKAFEELPRYSIELYAVYADEDVYVAGLVHDMEEARPFLAKVSTEGEVVWAEIVNVTYPGNQFVARGKILKDGGRFIAWVSNYVLFEFDEDGRVAKFYLIKGYVSDLDVKDGTIYLVRPPAYGERPGEVEVEEMRASTIPIDVLAEGLSLEVENLKCYSKKV